MTANNKYTKIHTKIAEQHRLRMTRFRVIRESGVQTLSTGSYK